MTESTFQFGSERHLIGTLTEPDAAGGPRPTVMVLLTNAGVISRSGPHRINVRVARTFAAVGLRSLRWDMSGLGDSGRPSGTLSIREQFVADTRAAMDEAQRRCGVSRFAMIGFCSGAEAAYFAAMKDARLVGVVLFDLFTYPTLKTLWLRIRNRVRRYGFLSAVRRAVVALTMRAFRSPPTVSAVELPWPSPTPTRAAFAAHLSELHARGTRALILHSAESELYEDQFRDNFHRLGIVGKVDYAYLRQCDHVFTTIEGQGALISTAVEWVQRLEVSEVPSGSRGGPGPCC